VFIFVLACAYSKSPKATKRSKRKRGGPDIIRDIPVNNDEVVNEITVTRQKKRIHISSKLVYIPPAPTTQPGVGTSATDVPPRDSDIYSDAEDMDRLPAMNSCERKGPRRSVSVRVSLFSFIHSMAHWCLGEARGMDGVSGRIHR